MKTENNNGDPVWANTLELLPNEGCLPVIGSCQISSILSTLDTTVPETHPQNMNLIILPSSNDFKMNEPLQSNYVILKENGANKSDKIKPAQTKEKPNDFEDMLYFVCNLCPFLCTKDTKITEHVENAHKNKTIRKLTPLKCPACHNIFYHKMSLRSHLIHDHGVGNSDLGVIIQAVVYYSSKNGKVSGETVPSAKSNNNNNCKSEILLDNTGGDSSNDGVENSKDEITNSSSEPDTKVLDLPPVNIQIKNDNKFGPHLKPPSNDPLKVNKCVLPMCKVRLREVSKLTYHMESHIENGFKCLECGEAFTFWKPLTGHLWRVHKVDMELYSCDKCDYKSFSLSKLNNIHRLIHSDVKAFVCEVCQKGFKNSKQLRNHKITHKQKSDKLLYICEACLRNFSDRRQLKVHMDVVHKKIKPYLCSYCGYKGSSKSSLKMHIRQHTGEKPFACDSCTYTTSDHNSLRRHKLRHSGQKPYKCPHCPYACIQSSTYKVHIKTKHPGMEKDLMFTCHECQFRSVNKDMFTSHMVTVHKQQPQVTTTN